MLSKREVVVAVSIMLALAGGLSGQALQFSSTTYSSGGTGTNTVAVADFNLDGALDVIASNSTTVWVNSSSFNYSGWFGQFAAGRPNGTLPGTGTAIPFFFNGGDAGTSGDRALNVATARFPLVNGTPNYPSIFGATGGPNSHTTRGLRGQPATNSGHTGFAASVGYTLNIVSEHSSWVAAGDLNGDGIDDAIVTNVNETTGAATGTISLYPGVASFGSLNPGFNPLTTSFTLPTVPTAYTGFSVTAGDLNGDGKADIVVATNTTAIVIYRSTSTSSAFSFAAPVIITGLAANSQYITIADVTGDHKPDILIATGTNTLIVLPNDGSGNFSSATAFTLTLTGGGLAMCAAAADVTRDGITDIAVADGTGNIQVFRGLGLGFFANPVTVSTGTANPVWVVAADMNSDGKPDLVVASKSDGLVAVMLNTTTTIVTAPRSLTFYATVGGSNPPSEAVNGTFDAGGAANYTNIGVTTNNTGNWLSTDAPASGPVTISVDITGLTAKVYQGTVTLNAGTGNATTVPITLNVATPSGTLTNASFPTPNTGSVNATAVGDFNNDGKIDVIEYSGFNNGSACSGNNGVPALWFIAGNGDGSFAPTASQIGSCFSGGFANMTFAAVADFNGDGNLDVALLENSGFGMQIALGDGTGHFTLLPSQYPVFGNSPRAIYATDVNNDGSPDVIVITVDNTANFQTHATVYINDGTGKVFTSTDSVIAANSANSFPGAVGDFNNDGFVDVVVANLNKGNLSYVPGAAGGTLGSFTTISIGTCTGPVSVAAGDFNKDGKLDLVVGCNNNTIVQVLLGNGNGTFQNPTSVNFGSGVAQNLTVADFDGDGNLDILFTNSSSSFIVLVGDGAGGFSLSPLASFSCTCSSNLAPFLPVDVSGDGRLDVIWPYGFGAIFERLGDLAATSTSVSSNPLTTAPAGQSVAFNATTITTVPSWAKATGVTTINDTLDGKLGQGNAVAGVFTVNAALTTGTHSLSDVYAGDSRTKPSNSGSNYTFNVVGAHLTFTTQPPLSTAAGATLANFVVTVQDSSNATVTGSNASISLTLNSGTFSSGTTTVVATSGVATFSGIKINTPGTYTITAAATNITSANSNSFAITVGPAATLVVAGYPSPTAAGTAHTFTVTAKDAGGNTATGYTGTVHFTSSDGQAVLPANYTFVGGDAGVHTFSATLKTVGTQSINATDTVTSSITGTQNNITVNAGASTNVTPNGTPQSAVVNTSYQPISVTVTDAVGNPIVGASVTFQAPAVGATATFTFLSSQTVLTDASGVATPATPLAGTTAGAFTITATVNSITANFNLSNLPDVPAFMNISGGDAQSTNVNTAFANPLKVTVLDQFNNLVGNAPVTFAAPNSGASGIFPGSQLTAIVNTNSSGVATSPVFTANGTFGSYQVVASTPGNPGQPGSPSLASRANSARRQTPRPTPPLPLFVTASFNLTNTAIPTMQIFAGNGQSATVGTAFATALQVKILDTLQQPAAGVTVTFTAPSSGAGGTFTPPVTAVTNGLGIATAPVYTANNISGANAPRATASLSGTALSATFGLTNLPGPAITMAPSGTPQNAIVLTPYGTTLSVKITDQFNNGVPGQSVVFAAPASGATGTFPGGTPSTVTVTTDANGNAAAPTFTANGTLGNFTVTATSGALTSRFSLTNIVASVGITAVSGSGQSASPSQQYGSPLVARVFDINGAGVPNASVTFTLPSTGPSGTFAGGGLTFTGITNSQGMITTPLVTANNFNGSFNVTATTAPSLSATFVLGIGTPTPVTVTPQLLIFNAEVGQAPPKAQFVNVQSFPTQDYHFIVDVPWLKVSVLPNGVLKDTLVVTVDHSALPPGHYDGNIIVNDIAGIVRVDLQVAPKPTIVPSAKSLAFRFTQGQGTPSEQMVYLTANTRNFNVTVTEVYVAPADATGWLKVAGDGNTTTPAPLHVGIAPDSLPPGTYQANIHVVSADAANSPMDIPVTMVIVPASQQ